MVLLYGNDTGNSNVQVFFDFEDINDDAHTPATRKRRCASAFYILLKGRKFFPLTLNHPDA